MLVLALADQMGEYKQQLQVLTDLSQKESHATVETFEVTAHIPPKILAAR